MFISISFNYRYLKKTKVNNVSLAEKYLLTFLLLSIVAYFFFFLFNLYYFSSIQFLGKKKCFRDPKEHSDYLCNPLCMYDCFYIPVSWLEMSRRWGTSLVVQWLRFHLLMQGGGFDPWSGS